MEVMTIIDIGADLNCIQGGLISTKYYYKTSGQLSSANESQMRIKYKLSKVYICQNNICFKASFVLVRNMIDKVILRTPFIFLLYAFTTNNHGITTQAIWYLLSRLIGGATMGWLVRFHSGIWNKAQKHYSTIKKEILYIVLCISKFQDDILNQRFLVQVDCKIAKYVLEKRCSKHSY